MERLRRKGKKHLDRVCHKHNTLRVGFQFLKKIFITGCGYFFDVQVASIIGYDVVAGCVNVIVVITAFNVGSYSLGVLPSFFFLLSCGYDVNVT